ncbi:MAG: 30S ribosomal protein S6 [Desulfobacterales bacterium]|jgi:small subunit ribosomal protein S6|nr:30S ribosomal protein S6 [Desulfobacterales bacterium]
MRRYETIFIVDPEVSDEQRGSIFERLAELISKYKGVLVMRDDWGMRKLAYEVRKRNRGFYVRLDYCGDGPLVDEIERSFRIDDKVIKYMTIILDNDADPDRIREEMAKSAEEKAVASESGDGASATAAKLGAVADDDDDDAGDTLNTDTDEEDEEA